MLDNDIDFNKKISHIACTERCTSCILDDSTEQPT